MGWPSREEILQQIGLDTSQWREATEIRELLQYLEQQKEIGIDEPDIPGRFSMYSNVARMMFRYTFHTTDVPYYDVTQKSLWYLRCKPPRENDQLHLDVRARYHILRKGRYLCVYANPNHKASKRLFTFDMQNARHRRSFADVKRWTAIKSQEYKTDLLEPPIHKDLLRVRQLHTGRHDKGNTRKLADIKKATTRSALSSTKLVSVDAGAQEDKENTSDSKLGIEVEIKPA